jgi:hypothetical protein
MARSQMGLYFTTPPPLPLLPNPPTHPSTQFGHLFAKGETREGAIRAMVVALKEIKIRGEIRTNADYACEMIQHVDFLHDRHHTGWLDARIAAQVWVGGGDGNVLEGSLGWREQQTREWMAAGHRRLHFYFGHRLKKLFLLRLSQPRSQPNPTPCCRSPPAARPGTSL